MSRHRSKERDRKGWSPIRVGSDNEVTSSRHHHRSSDSVRDHSEKRKRIKLSRYDIREEKSTRSHEDKSRRSHEDAIRDHPDSSKDRTTKKRKWRSEGDRTSTREEISYTETSLNKTKSHSRGGYTGCEDDAYSGYARGSSSNKKRKRSRSSSEDNDKCLELVIIGKSKNAGQFCVLGYDGSQIYRPVNFSTGSLFWQEDRFEVGKMYRFYLNGDKRSYNKLSAHPHRYNDINVTDKTESLHDREKAKSLIKMLIDQAKSHMDFYDVLENKFVQEDTECPSACLYRCSARDVELYRSRVGKPRVAVGRFDFPFAGVYSDIQKTFDDYDRNVVVVLSLTRPFGGFSDRVFNPKRCYILVVGLHSY